jgi:hypothetical protein
MVSLFELDKLIDLWTYGRSEGVAGSEGGGGRLMRVGVAESMMRPPVILRVL